MVSVPRAERRTGCVVSVPRTESREEGLLCGE